MTYDNPVNPNFSDLGGTTDTSARDAAQADLIPKGTYNGLVVNYTTRDAHERSPFAGTKLVRIRVKLDDIGLPLFFDISGYDRRWPDGGMAREHKLANQMAAATGTIGKGLEDTLETAKLQRLQYVITVKSNEGKDRDPENTVVAIRTPK